MIVHASVGVKWLVLETDSAVDPGIARRVRLLAEFGP